MSNPLIDFESSKTLSHQKLERQNARKNMLEKVNLNLNLPVYTLTWIYSMFYPHAFLTYKYSDIQKFSFMKAAVTTFHCACYIRYNNLQIIFIHP